MANGMWKRTWVEIDLDAIVHNYEQVCSLCQPGALVTCVLKANAYGHGAVAVAGALAKAGAKSFAVSCFREALELSRAGIKGELFIMTATEEEALPEAIRRGMALTVCSLDQAERVNRAAAALHMTAAVHVKVDTGMHRLGLMPGPEAIEDIQAMGRMGNLSVQGLYSHLALTDQDHDQRQHAFLKGMYDDLNGRGMKIPQMHLCDSIGLVRYPKWQYQRVRVGAMLFGVRPMRSEHLPFSCREALRLKTVVAQVRKVPAGDTVGYDETPLARESLVATLCAGYADGYPRRMSRVACVCIRDRLAPVLGLVCMDQMMVDVTDIPGAREGDEAVLLGGPIPFSQYADWAQTNRNEAIAAIGRRPPRVYFQGGQVVGVVDELAGEERG